MVLTVAHKPQCRAAQNWRATYLNGLAVVQEAESAFRWPAYREECRTASEIQAHGAMLCRRVQRKRKGQEGIQRGHS